VFFALFFSILSAAQATSFLPNYAKARLSAKRIFALEDLVPAIDSYSEDGDKLVSVSMQTMCIYMYDFKLAVNQHSKSAHTYSQL